MGVRWSELRKHTHANMHTLKIHPFNIITVYNIFFTYPYKPTYTQIYTCTHMDEEDRYSFLFFRQKLK